MSTIIGWDNTDSRIRMRCLLLVALAMVGILLAGCSGPAAKNDTPPADSSRQEASAGNDETVESAQSADERVASQSGLDDASGAKLIGLWKWVDYSVDESDFAGLSEEERKAAQYKVQDYYTSFGLVGCYYQFYDDGTYKRRYAVGTGSEADSGGTWTETGNMTYECVPASDGASANLSVTELSFAEDGRLIQSPASKKQGTINAVLFYEKVDGGDIDALTAEPVPNGIIYRANVDVLSGNPEAVRVANVDDKGTVEQADDAVEIILDRAHLQELPLKDYFVVEECEGYPNGLAIEINERVMTEDALTLRGARPDVENLILSLNTKAASGADSGTAARNTGAVQNPVGR